MTRPNTGASFFEMELEDLDAKYVKLEVDVSFAEASDAERASDASEDDEGGDGGARGEREKLVKSSSRLRRDAASDLKTTRDVRTTRS